jgi:hypothetical protein
MLPLMHFANSDQSLGRFGLSRRGRRSLGCDTVTRSKLLRLQLHRFP